MVIIFSPVNGSTHTNSYLGPKAYTFLSMKNVNKVTKVTIS